MSYAILFFSCPFSLTCYVVIHSVVTLLLRLFGDLPIYDLFDFSMMTYLTGRTTRFEDLSNEVLFEIFEYLHGEELFTAFYDLIFRFNQILNDPRLLMHIAFARISSMQSRYNWKDIRFVNVTLSRVNSPMIAADLQGSSVMPYASQLSLDEVFLPDLMVGIPSIKSQMPNLVHLSIKTYHHYPITTNNNMAFIIERLIDLPLLRTFSLNAMYDSKETVNVSLSNLKPIPLLERLSIIGCHFPLLTVIDLMTNSPRLYSLQMKIQRNNESADYSVFQQLTRATLKLIGFDDLNLQKLFRSMKQIVSLRLDSDTFTSALRLPIASTARISKIPIGYFNDY